MALAFARRRRGCRLSASGREPGSTYVICTNPRSGSWLLSEGLGSTGIAGNPREWFNKLEEQRQRAHWRLRHENDLRYGDYLALARAQSTSSNGLCGLKLMYYQFAELPARIEALGGPAGLDPAQAMMQLFPQPHYLWLTRRDKIRQAISLLIASQTSRWWSIDGVASAPAGTGRDDPPFDAHAIARLERSLTENDARWQAYFTANGIVPHIVYYEDLLADYEGTIASVLGWLGIAEADAVRIPPSRLKRQSDERNEDWLARYRLVKSRMDSPDDKAATDDARILECQPDQSDPVPDGWKQWIAESKVLGRGDSEIVEILARNGIAAAAGAEEVRKAGSDPYFQHSLPVQKRLRRAASLLNVQQQLARLDPQAHIIERRSNLGGDEFRDRYYAANRPVIIENAMTDWTAMTRWSPEYLRQVAGDHVVEVMTGRDGNPDYERDGGRHRTAMRFGEYVDKVHSGKVTNDYYLVANNGFLERPEAQRLFEDITAFPEYLDPTLLGGRCFLWFGPAGTITPLHHDTSNILVGQVKGRKHYRLIPSNQSQYVYNSFGVFSDVDCENPDFGRHPLFRHATVIDLVLEPGEVLFLPVGWWHWVQAIDVSLSVSFTNFRYPNHFAWE